MDRPRLFSTFVLWLLAQLYAELPEAGDLPKPKLAFFFDEAHLLFDDASEALMEQIERTARLIRSKGVGVYFVTQAPTDVPSSVLAQLGNRVQHALRAFTPEDADALRKTARTFPETPRSTTSRRRSRRSASARPWSRCSRRRASRRRSRRPGSCRPDSRMAPLAPEEIRGPGRGQPARRPGTARPSTARAPTSSSPRGSRAARGRAAGARDARRASRPRRRTGSRG